MNASPEAIAREMARVAAFGPPPPPPWADDPAMAERIREALVDLDRAGGWIKPDPLLDSDAIPAPDFHTEARRAGEWPEPRPVREVTS